MSRPEHIGPPELFYNETEAAKYTNNTRIIDIQMSMSSRAIELLNLPEDQPSFILDVGYVCYDLTLLYPVRVFLFLFCCRRNLLHVKLQDSI